MEDFLKKAKSSAQIIATLRSSEKSRILNEMADALISHSEQVIAENMKDMDAGRKNGLDSALLDRLLLDEGRIAGMAESLRDSCAQRTGGKSSGRVAQRRQSAYRKGDGTHRCYRCHI